MAHFAIYLLYRCGAALICLLPISVGFRIGAVMGRCAFYALPHLRWLAVRNLARAFEEKNDAEIRAIAREHFERLGANLVASIKLASMTREEIFTRVSVEIPDEIRQRRTREHRGWVAMVSHLGAWELFAQLGCILPEYSVGAMYQPLRNRYIDAHIRKLRAAEQVRLFDRRSELMSATAFLREIGSVLGVLVDQHAGDAGLWTPFFGRLTSTSTLAATLSAHADAPIVPIAVYTCGVARWRVVVSPIMEPSPEVQPTVTRINEVLEKQIRISPQDWLWSHDRWKVPRPFFLLDHSARGIHVPVGTKLKPFHVLVVESAVQAMPQSALQAIKEGRPDMELQVWSDNPIQSPLNVLLQQLRAFDVVFLLNASVNIAVAAWLARVPRRVGFGSHPGRVFLNQVIAMDSASAEESYLALVRACGANPSKHQLSRAA